MTESVENPSYIENFQTPERFAAAQRVCEAIDDDQLRGELLDAYREWAALQVKTFTYYAEYEDAEDVRGTVDASGVTEAMSIAADDLLLQVGKDPISYGKLTRMTIESSDGIKATITPEYDDV